MFLALLFFLRFLPVFPFFLSFFIFILLFGFYLVIRYHHHHHHYHHHLLLLLLLPLMLLFFFLIPDVILSLSSFLIVPLPCPSFLQSDPPWEVLAERPCRSVAVSGVLVGLPLALLRALQALPGLGPIGNDNMTKKEQERTKKKKDRKKERKKEDEGKEDSSCNEPGTRCLKMNKSESTMVNYFSVLRI